MKHIQIYTDGACRGNPGPGGWGALLQFGTKRKTISGAEKLTTNNRMELMAAIQALSVIKEPCKIDLHTDSQYLQKGVTVWIHQWKKALWKKKDKTQVKNADLWQLLDKLRDNHDITWHWVKGHNGHPENELADQLANEAIDQLLRS